MRNLLLAVAFLPLILDAQEGIDCSAISFDADGDYAIGVGDLVAFLGVFGANFDLDQDSILDCVDDCVGQFDECGICNGPGPQFIVIESIISEIDSIYDATQDQWVYFETPSDTLFTLSCDSVTGFLDCIIQDSVLYGLDSVYIETIQEYLVYEFPIDTIQLLECDSVSPLPPCGDSILFDNYWYQTILIGEQCWFAENLRTAEFSNGDSLLSNLSPDEWGSLNWQDQPTPAMSIYGEGESSCSDEFALLGFGFEACNEALALEEYGCLYNHFAVISPEGLCPVGFHVPLISEWEDLAAFLGEGGYLDSDGNPSGSALQSMQGWWEDVGINSGGEDVFGFSALPGGLRSSENGGFNNAGYGGYWWASSAPNSINAYYFSIRFDGWLGDPPLAISRSTGLSVRCLRDFE